MRPRAPLALAALLLAASPAAGDEPAALPRRLAIGGEVSGAMAPMDRGYFNDSDYGTGALRELRVGLSLEAHAGRRVSLLGEVRSSAYPAGPAPGEHGHVESPRVYALYLRVRPWLDRRFDVQAGLIPPTFGSFPRRPYGPDNPLVGLPLAYQYLTTVRRDAAPATVDDMLRVRGSGWSMRYPVGSSTFAAGLPLASALRWDTGVQARLGAGPLELAAAVTQGSLGSPRVDDDNAGKQVSGRVAWRPRAGLALGASGSRGAYLADDVSRLLPAGRSYRQRAWGADVEYSRGYWLARAESVWTAWDSPVWASPLRAGALSAEGRYKVVPGAWVAARVDHLGFSQVRGALGVLTWDAPVWRLEAGGGYALRRNLLLKAAWQHNWRDGGRVRSQGLATAQVLYWF
jgi:hypothetical protein